MFVIGEMGKGRDILHEKSKQIGTNSNRIVLE